MSRRSPTTLNASLMCADPMDLGAEAEALATAGIDMFHCDIMDGVFVPNVTLGLYQVAAIVAAQPIPVEAHLMVTRPEDYIQPLAEAGVRYITVHAESTAHLSRVLHQVADAGVGVGLSLNPATPVQNAKDVIHLVDLFQVMTVDPGFAGQPFLERGVERVAEARDLLEAYGRDRTSLQVDGSINLTTIREVTAAGADSLVLGSSSLFQVPMDQYPDRIAQLRRAADVQLAN